MELGVRSTANVAQCSRHAECMAVYKGASLTGRGSMVPVGNRMGESIAMVTVHMIIGSLVVLAYLVLAVGNAIQLSGDRTLTWTRQLSMAAALLLLLQYVLGFSLLGKAVIVTRLLDRGWIEDARISVCDRRPGNTQCVSVHLGGRRTSQAPRGPERWSGSGAQSRHVGRGTGSRE